MFAAIYQRVATATVVRQRAAGIGTAEIAARVAMARDAVTFFESELPGLASAAIGLLGSLGMLLFFDWPSGLLLLGLVLPVRMVYRRFGHRARQLNHDLNDQTEQEIDHIAHAGRARVARHFESFCRLRIQLSQAEAGSWSLVEVFSIAAVVSVLLRSTRLPGIGAGELYALLPYVWRVLESLEQAPLLVQRLGRLIDIRHRLELNVALAGPEGPA